MKNAPMSIGACQMIVVLIGGHTPTQPSPLEGEGLSNYSLAPAGLVAGGGFMTRFSRKNSIMR